jgi:hypothetical protein
MKILVSSNCQTGGIALCLRTLFRSAEIQARPITLRDLGTGREVYRGLLSSTDVWVTIGQEAIASDFPRLIVKKIPTIRFSAFQPDQVRAHSGTTERRIRCLDSNDHSAIVLWSWRRGLTVQEAQKLFNRDVFQALGYLKRWDMDEAALRESFVACGLDFSRVWNKIKRRGIFMHADTHPKLLLLAEIAKQIAIQLGAGDSIYDEPIHEFLPDALSIEVWPVYPPIANHFGLEGMYRWRFRDRYVNSLPAYIAGAYKSYEDQELDRDNIQCSAFIDGTLDRVLREFVSAER